MALDLDELWPSDARNQKVVTATFGQYWCFWLGSRSREMVTGHQMLIGVWKIDAI